MVPGRLSIRSRKGTSWSDGGGSAGTTGISPVKHMSMTTGNMPQSMAQSQLIPYWPCQNCFKLSIIYHSKLSMQAGTPNKIGQNKFLCSNTCTAESLIAVKSYDFICKWKCLCTFYFRDFKCHKQYSSFSLSKVKQLQLKQLFCHCSYKYCEWYLVASTVSICALQFFI